MVTRFIQHGRGVGRILLNGQVPRVDEDLKSKGHLHDMGTSTRDMTFFRFVLHSIFLFGLHPNTYKCEITVWGVLFPCWWFYMSWIWGVFFPFPDKMTIIDVNYNFSAPCTDDFRSIFWKGGATPIPLVLSFPKTGNFGWLTFRHPPKIIGKIPDVPFDEELIYCLFFQRISGECTQHFNFHDEIHVTGIFTHILGWIFMVYNYYGKYTYKSSHGNPSMGICDTPSRPMMQKSTSCASLNLGWLLLGGSQQPTGGLVALALDHRRFDGWFRDPIRKPPDKYETKVVICWEYHRYFTNLNWWFFPTVFHCFKFYSPLVVSERTYLFSWRSSIFIDQCARQNE